MKIVDIAFVKLYFVYRECILIHIVYTKLIEKSLKYGILKILYTLLLT